MADLKRCDRCEAIWEPEIHSDHYDGPVDSNLCTISIIIPVDNSRRGNDAEAFSRNLELCRKCGLFFKAELTKKPF